mmetsp:Transcript_30829/g.72699  ORF Transcript_30829/g.72699 Transcript_30829/m.72699 type:complete len:591 (+) Transcript_30829:139-1911(+)
MLLPQYEGIANAIGQNADTGLNQGIYLERFLHQQHQQNQRNIQQQVTINGKDGIGRFNGSSNNCIINEHTRVGKPAFNRNTPSPRIKVANSSSIGITNNGMIIGVDHRQQQQQQQQQQQHHEQQQQRNRMIAFLQEQQQQLVASGLVCGSSDLKCNVALSGLSNNVSLGSQLRGRDSCSIGTGMSSGAWDGFGGNGVIGGQIRGAANGRTLYSTDQDIFLNANRYPTLRGNVGGNQFAQSGEGNGSHSGTSLNPTMGGLSRFSVQHQALAQASLRSQQKSNGKSFSDLMLAKQAAFLEAAQARVPRTNRLPCGARGMKSDHNSSTAYFDIPENARHGQHLLCSHAVCRAAGVKFRYCFYCKKPVTKQNFRSRHLHADLDPSKKKEGEKIVDSNSKGSKNKSTSDQKKAINASKSNERTIKKTMATSLQEGAIQGLLTNDNKFSITSLGTSLMGKCEGKRCCPSEQECLIRPSKIPKLLDSNVEPVCRKRSRWTELLEERPSDDLEAIHSWTGKILSMSNPAMGSVNCGSEEFIQQRSQKFDLDNVSSEGLSMYWNALLNERPKGEDDKDSVTQWLVRALEVSEKYKKVKK